MNKVVRIKESDLLKLVDAAMWFVSDAPHSKEVDEVANLCELIRQKALKDKRNRGEKPLP